MVGVKPTEWNAAPHRTMHRPSSICGGAPGGRPPDRAGDERHEYSTPRPGPPRLGLCYSVSKARPCVRDNQPRGNMFGVAIRFGHDQPDEYGKLADRCNTAKPQTRRPLGHRVNPEAYPHFLHAETNPPRPGRRGRSAFGIGLAATGGVAGAAELWPLDSGLWTSPPAGFSS